MSTSVDTDVINQTPQSFSVEIQRVYVREQSCKIPQGSSVFQTETKLETSTELNIHNQPLAKDIFEVCLNITLTAKSGQSTIYVANAQQAGILKTNCVDEHPLSQLLNVQMPNLLYPYIRKVIADLVFHASFPVVFLPLVDFAGMFQQRRMEATQNQPKKEVVTDDLVFH